MEILRGKFKEKTGNFMNFDEIILQKFLNKL